MKILLALLFCITLSGCIPRIITVRVMDITSDHVRDLEMQNAALKAANNYLRGVDKDFK
jgi:hypothetical protein